jgi:hypothetical protein
MKYLKNYNMELITESRWFELSVMRSEYKRDDELKEFFLELLDIGGKIFGIKNSTHTLVDKDFEVKDRLSYMTEPIFNAYTLRMRFEDTSSAISTGDIDTQMSKTISFFSEFDDALIKIKDFGYKFKLKKIVFDPNGTGDIMFDIVMYHPEDTIPWEHIFAPYEE